MIDQVFYDYIAGAVVFGGAGFYYGSAEGAVAPYCVMFKVSDLERPETLCNRQGETGRALFQFSYYVGGSNADPSNAAASILALDTIKRQVALIRGEIDNGVEAYRIWNNITNSARVIGEGSESLTAWGAIFECEIWWEEITLET